jgi:mevalonate kinase
VKNVDRFKGQIMLNRTSLISLANSIVPGLVERGGGVRDLVVREIMRPDRKGTMMVLHILCDPCDAMGANLINQVCEGLRPQVEQITQEEVGMCILSNLTDQNLAGARIRIKNIDPGLGKRIDLTGEHSILRGFRAVSLPREDLNLTLTFEPSPNGGLKIAPKDASFSVRKVLNAFDKIRSGQGEMTFSNLQKEGLSGILSISGEIPLGAGLGSSAAFCLAIVKWLASLLSIPSSKICTLATELENEFHGKSSGIDVATIFHGEPIGIRLESADSGERRSLIRKLGVKSLPRFTFHDTGIRSSTKTCVEQVQNLQFTDPEKAQALDQLMDYASVEAEKGLILFSKGNHREGLKYLSHAMNEAHSIFQEWGLVPKEASLLIENLKRKGALAAKLTGSGGGGITVALWDESI